MEFFNLGQNSKTKEKLKPRFEAFLESLEKFTYLFKYSSKLSGKIEKNAPSKEAQKEYVSNLLEAFKFDYMPEKRNVVYHVVSNEWFQKWQKYVGILQTTEDEDMQD